MVANSAPERESKPTRERREDEQSLDSFGVRGEGKKGPNKHRREQKYSKKWERDRKADEGKEEDQKQKKRDGERERARERERERERERGRTHYLVY